MVDVGTGFILLSGLIWVTILIPVQWKQAGAGRVNLQKMVIFQQATGSSIAAGYSGGLLATLIPLANLYFMIFKPL